MFIFIRYIVSLTIIFAKYQSNKASKYILLTQFCHNSLYLVSIFSHVILVFSVFEYDK